MAFEEYSTSLILRNTRFLGALKKCQNLRKLSLQFPVQYLDDRVAAQNNFIPLKGFNNLTSLELYQFYGDEARLAKDIAGVLHQNLALRTLGLGLACDCDIDTFPEATILEGDCRLLEDICIEYGSRDKKPLELQTLRLGHGLCIRASTPNAGNFLEKLLRIRGLRKLHVFNGPVRFGSLDGDLENMEIDWILLKDCSALRQLSVSRLGDDVKEFLNGTAKSVHELIVTDSRGIRDGGGPIFEALNLQLSMLYTVEDGPDSSDSEDPWSDTDSSATDPPQTDPAQSDILETNPSETDVPHSSAASNETRPSRPDESVKTILDRLQDGGEHLKQLSISIDLDTQWVSSCHTFRARTALTILGAIFYSSTKLTISDSSVSGTQNLASRKMAK
jgi:hypothetical protein